MKFFPATKNNGIYTIVMIFVTLLAAFFRLWRLPELPPGLWYDEAFNGMDALWMLETGSPQIFFVGNNGREPMFQYLAALFLGVFGASPYSLRLTSAVVGIATIPLVYRWVTTLFSKAPQRHFLGVFAAAGLALSMWHVSMSRLGFRAVLLPLFVVIIAYFFWRGWQRKSKLYFVGAGITLGLSQYTYLPARLLPLVFVLFAAAWMLLPGVAVFKSKRGSRIRSLWLGLVMMASVSLLIFLPLGIFFFNHPEHFLKRSADVSITSEIEKGNTTLPQHLMDAVRVFIDGSDPQWRHNLVGRPGFNWLNLIGFWVGLAVSVASLRRAPYLFLVVGLFIFWLPAVFSAPATSVMRLGGALPFYYTLMAVGWLALSRRLAQIGPRAITADRLQWTFLVSLVIVSAGITGYDYFVRWADEPLVYRDFDGPLVDLTKRVLEESQSSSVLLPFSIYRHPTTRFLLHSRFQDAPLPLNINADPTVLMTTPDISRILSGYNQLSSNYYMWLSSSGQAYLSRQELAPNLLTQLKLNKTLPAVVNALTGAVVANLALLEQGQLAWDLFTTETTFKPVDYVWDDLFRLANFQVLPDPVQAGQTLTLKLYWQLPGQQRLGQQLPDQHIVIQLINRQGDVLDQWQEPAFPRLVTLWRQGDIAVNQQHELYIGPQTAAGPYLLQVSLVDPDSNEKLPVATPQGTWVEQPLSLGLIYVTSDQSDPRQPQTQIHFQLGGDIELVGLDTPQLVMNESPYLRGQLFWQTRANLNTDYVPFVILSNSEGQVAVQQDIDHFSGQYPTSRWRPGEMVVDEFVLPLPSKMPAGNYQLLTGMVRATDGKRLPAYDPQGQRLANDMIVLTQMTVP